MLNTTQDFQLVRNKKRKFKVKPLKNASCVQSSADNDASEDYIIKRLGALRKEISSSEFFGNCQQVMHNCLKSLNTSKVRHLVCFGIGSFSTCLIAMHQLAFILELIDLFEIQITKFYDPVFNELEKQILKKLRCEIIPENCEGKYAAECITVFYLPHCPKQLTNNLLWKNWSLRNLSNVIIVGNSFENMQQNTPNRLLKQDAGYVVRCSKWVTEILLTNNYQYGDVFNDTSLHIFPKERLEHVTDKEWQDNPMPSYEDPELITIEFESKLSIR